MPPRPRKPRPPGVNRPWVGARVAPSTAAWLADERARTGEKLGRLLDRLVTQVATAPRSE